MRLVRNALAFIVVLLISGCAASSDPTKVSDSQRDEYNETIDELNRAWEDFKVAGSACAPANTAPCFDAAFESSGIMEAARKLWSTAVNFQAAVDPGECRSSLEVLEERVRDLVTNLEILSHGYLEGDAIEETITDTVRGWDAVVEAAQHASEACP